MLDRKGPERQEDGEERALPLIITVQQVPAWTRVAESAPSLSGGVDSGPSFSPRRDLHASLASLLAAASCPFPPFALFQGAASQPSWPTRFPVTLANERLLQTPRSKKRGVPGVSPPHSASGCSQHFPPDRSPHASRTCHMAQLLDSAHPASSRHGRTDGSSCC